jgi:hypothetical protein
MNKYINVKEVLEIDHLRLKNANLHLRNIYLQMKIDKLAYSNEQPHSVKEMTVKDDTGKLGTTTKLKATRPLNSKELRAVSTEYARNQEFYKKNREILSDRHWYLIDKQKIIADDIDKKKVIQILVKLKSDDYLLIQKGQEKKSYEVNHIETSINEETGQAKVKNVEIMAYDKTKYGGKWSFILDTGAQITCIDSAIFSVSDPSLFLKLEQVSIDTVGGRVKRFKYGCYLKVDGNTIEVELVPMHKSLIGRDVLKYFRMEWIRWDIVNLEWRGDGLTLDEIMDQFAPNTNVRVNQVDEMDIEKASTKPKEVKKNIWVTSSPSQYPFDANSEEDWTGFEDDGVDD